MPRLERSEIQQVDALRSHLATMVEGAPPVLSTLVPELRTLLRADRGLAYGVRVEDAEQDIRFLHATSLEADMREVLSRMYREEPSRTAHFNPARPELRQRNRAYVMDELVALTGNSAPRAFTEGFPRLLLTGKDQARVLVCQGDSLLAWVGGFRDEPFTWREKRILEELTPALQRRLWLDRQLDVSQFALAALDEALALIPAATFVIKASGRIAHANEAGRLRLEQDRLGVRDALERSLRSPCPEAPFTVTPLASRGAPGYWLAVERGRPPDRAALTADTARRFGLSKRQSEVLALLLKGYANKSIAAELQCTVSTVEQHITAILRKAGVTSRAELIVKVSPLAR